MSSTLSPHTKAQLSKVDDAARAELAHPLSERELQIVAYVATGATNAEIGQSLAISKQTVKNHMSNILAKTGAVSRQHLMLLALGRQWVDPAATFATAERQAAFNRELSAYAW